jgi:GTP-binding protein
MRFVDETKVYVKAGDGGRGCISFRREKYVPRGGPDGGDGGRGGNVIFKATSLIHTLLDFKYRQHLKAENGDHGKGKGKKGKNGDDLLALVPLGTVIKTAETAKIIADLTKDGQEAIVAHGGKEGRGNIHFLSPTRQAPRYAEPGERGEELWLNLELKILAHVSLIGKPNVGKSSLIKALSRARPEVASYPFTTLTPQLGAVEIEGFLPFVVAEVPGLLKGAHKGCGLGLHFLRHIERSFIIAYVLDASCIIPDSPLINLDELNAEISAYNSNLLQKRKVVIINKIDLPDGKSNLPVIVRALKERNLNFWAVSALKKQGIKELKRGLAEEVNEIKYEELN